MFYKGVLKNNSVKSKSLIKTIILAISEKRKMFFINNVPLL